jgi:hypothetical protein
MLISSIRLAAKLRACLVNAVTGKVKIIPKTTSPVGRLTGTSIRLLVTDLSQLLNNRKLDPTFAQALSTQRSGIAC